MTPAASAKALEALRQGVLSLDPEGEKGLEGLVAHVLSAILQRQFRVASAGRQHGRDGATKPGAFDVFFEAKLYSGKPPRAEDLQSKLLSAINAHHPYLDLWVLACTTPLGEGAASDLIKGGERFGITVVPLDWSEHPLPPLAVLLASGPDTVAEWLGTRAEEGGRASILALLDAVADHASFSGGMGGDRRPTRGGNVRVIAAATARTP